MNKKEKAFALASSAKTPAELMAAHVAMRLAFPRLARAFRCSCFACLESAADRAEAGRK